MSEPPLVVFLCIQNAGRSQMAAAWLQHLAGGRVRAASGGSNPAHEVHAPVVEVMREVGIDLASNVPQRWTDELIQSATRVVTMGCGDTCPVFRGVRYEDWPVDDPSGLQLADVRHIRDDIEQRVRTLLAALEPATTAIQEQA